MSYLILNFFRPPTSLFGRFVFYMAVHVTLEVISPSKDFRTNGTKVLTASVLGQTSIVLWSHVVHGRLVASTLFWTFVTAEDVFADPLLRIVVERITTPIFCIFSWSATFPFFWNVAILVKLFAKRVIVGFFGSFEVVTKQFASVFFFLLYGIVAVFRLFRINVTCEWGYFYINY